MNNTTTQSERTNDVTHVIFHQIHPSHDIVVPLEDAWAFFVDRQVAKAPCVEVSRAVIKHGDATFKTFAKAWMVWDFSAKVWQLARVGLGAYGDGGPTNPHISGRKSELRLDEAGWIRGLV